MKGPRPAPRKKRSKSQPRTNTLGEPIEETSEAPPFSAQASAEDQGSSKEPGADVPGPEEITKGSNLDAEAEPAVSGSEAKEESAGDPTSRSRDPTKDSKKKVRVSSGPARSMKYGPVKASSPSAPPADQDIEGKSAQKSGQEPVTSGGETKRRFVTI